MSKNWWRRRWLRVCGWRAFWWAALRDSRVGDAWRCKVMRRHHAKMGSYGRCYRCGKPVD